MKRFCLRLRKFLRRFRFVKRMRKYRCQRDVLAEEWRHGWHRVSKEVLYILNEIEGEKE
jgi:hypothetical protein